MSNVELSHLLKPCLSSGEKETPSTMKKTEKNKRDEIVFLKEEHLVKMKSLKEYYKTKIKNFELISKVEKESIKDFYLEEIKVLENIFKNKIKNYEQIIDTLKETHSFEINSLVKENEKIAFQGNCEKQYQQQKEDVIGQKNETLFSTSSWENIENKISFEVNKEDLQLLKRIITNISYCNKEYELYSNFNLKQQFISLYKFFGLSPSLLENSSCSVCMKILLDKITELRQQKWFYGHVNSQLAHIILDSAHTNSFFICYNFNDSPFKFYIYIKETEQYKRITTIHLRPRKKQLHFGASDEGSEKYLDTINVILQHYQQHLKLKPLEISSILDYDRNLSFSFSLKDTELSLSDEEKSSYSHSKKVLCHGIYVLFKTIKIFDQSFAMKLYVWKNLSDDFFGLYNNILGYHVMQEYNEKRITLFDWRHQHQDLKEEQILSVIQSLISVLKDIHSFGFLHNGISANSFYVEGKIVVVRPGSIDSPSFISSHEIPFLSDADEKAKYLKNLFTRNSKWVAPEVLSDVKNASTRSDVWSLSLLICFIFDPTCIDDLEINVSKIATGWFSSLSSYRDQFMGLIKDGLKSPPTCRPSLNQLSNSISGLAKQFNQYLCNKSLFEKRKKYEKKIYDIQKELEFFEYQKIEEEEEENT